MKPQTGSLERSKKLINFQQEKQREKRERCKTPISERKARRLHRPCGHPKNEGVAPAAPRAQIQQLRSDGPKPQNDNLTRHERVTLKYK